MRAFAPSILVVDDDFDVRDVLIRLLQEHGYEVHAAADGNAALEAAARRHIDIVLLDILMPDKDGLETILQLHLEFPDIVIVAISGASFDFLSAARKFGAHHTLRKPIFEQDLIGLIERIVRARPRDRAVESRVEDRRRQFRAV